jgi:hypothetical protein
MKPNDQPHSRPTHAAVSWSTALEEGRSGSGTVEVGNNGKDIMLGSGKGCTLRRLGADFVLAFVFHTRAYAVSLRALPTETILSDSAVSSPASFRTDQPNQAIHKAQTRPDQARLLLSVAFAAIVAFNLGFWRHLRRVYASPRRSVWRRG